MTRLEQKTPRCVRCNFVKPKAEFGKRTGGHLHSWCRHCHNEHARDVRAKARETSRMFCGND